MIIIIMKYLLNRNLDALYIITHLTRSDTSNGKRQ